MFCKVHINIRENHQEGIVCVENKICIAINCGCDTVPSNDRVIDGVIIADSSYHSKVRATIIGGDQITLWNTISVM
jgi:hypothetical protein